MRNKTLSIGSISHGTMRPEDLYDSFLSELRAIAPRRAAKLEKEHAAAVRECGEDDALSETVNELFDTLGEYCPPYCYFGAHEGDGSDYGVWVSWDSLEDDCRYGEVLKVSDTSEIPRGYTGMVLHVNDHGNATLYRYSRGRGREVWAVV